MASYLVAKLNVIFGPASGPGYIAGESPNGLVLLAGSPIARPVLAMHRGSGRVAASTLSSDVDGTYRLDGLNPNEEFDVICRDTTGVERDKIIGRVKPKPY